MNVSFIATIAFAALVIIGAFLANLTVLIFTNSQWHVSGVILSLLAAAASYWAQHHFTQAAYALHELSLAPALTGYATAATNADELGRWFQIGGIAALVASIVCFWLGMRP